MPGVQSTHPTRKPITLDEMELFFDFVARRMQKLSPDLARLYFPIWRALVRERGKLLETEAARARVIRQEIQRPPLRQTQIL